MTPLPLKPRKALYKAFLKVKPNRTDIERFKANLIRKEMDKSITFNMAHIGLNRGLYIVFL